MIEDLKLKDWKIGDRCLGENYVDVPLRIGTMCYNMMSYLWRVSSVEKALSNLGKII